MIVIQQDRPQSTSLPGIAHATWAGRAQGLTQLSLWRQTLAPGAATPPHGHGCDEVVLCQGGRGHVHVDGRAIPFGANQTLVLPKGLLHQIINDGEAPLEILGILSATAVETHFPDGRMIELPWNG